MKYTRKYRNKNKTRTTRNSRAKARRKMHTKDFIIKNATPKNINIISEKIAQGISVGSYSPTINRDLVTLESIQKNELVHCNVEKAYEHKEPLKIGVAGSNKNECYYYYTPQAKAFLLKNLAANKHIDPKKIVPPLQMQANCWFNTMFVTFFVSDKGRKFFHFLRQLMIEGRQQDGSKIPPKLRDAFALLNFGIEACLTGNEYAYRLNTNSIIHYLYDSIPEAYKQKYPYIVDVDQAGNPLLYYNSIINYLNNESIIMLFIRDADLNWKKKAVEYSKKMNHVPHIIVLEIYDEKSLEFNRKPENFILNDAKYQIDSAVIRDTTKQHFCATITCEGAEYGYDGMSFHRMVPIRWKNKLNKDFSWQFEGTKDSDGTPLEWNFTKSYQLLMYYRV
jgi:hypothetical protein